MASGRSDLLVLADQLRAFRRDDDSEEAQAGALAVAELVTLIRRAITE